QLICPCSFLGGICSFWSNDQIGERAISSSASSVSYPEFRLNSSSSIASTEEAVSSVSTGAATKQGESAINRAGIPCRMVVYFKLRK
ncbi:hypothetical protein, partial [Vibrio cholerae]|uniref:hypothetical protein n=1 Tax=Vibrio cholerae TaxID=666 RepID=UPI0022F2CA47